jgi:hypothetical protein
MRSLVLLLAVAPLARAAGPPMEAFLTPTQRARLEEQQNLFGRAEYALTSPEGREGMRGYLEQMLAIERDVFQVPRTFYGWALMTLLAEQYQATGRCSAALSLYEESQAFCLRTLGRDHWQMAQAQGRTVVARRINALGWAEHQGYQRIRALVGVMSRCVREQAIQEGLEASREAVTLARRLFGEDSLPCAEALVMHGQLLFLGQDGRAVPILEAACRKLEAHLGRGHPDTCVPRLLLAFCHYRADRPDLGRSIGREALAIARRHSHLPDKEAKAVLTLTVGMENDGVEKIARVLQARKALEERPGLENHLRAKGLGLFDQAITALRNGEDAQILYDYGVHYLK